MKKVEAFLARDLTKLGVSYDLFRKKPTWDEKDNYWKTDGPVIGGRISLTDTAVAWMFPTVEIQPSEMTVVGIAA